ncbi:MAG TPA: hemolysin III family protein [Propionicimonas sp.]|nr:hemolysin III family protein [Propionicimonas sp.]HRA05433.1 hemolysin III family protein [Propionicimonas sp.]
MATETVPDKPLLRGWLHLGMSVLVVLGGVLLLVLAPGVLGKAGSAVWLAGAMILFGMSAIYHIGHWSPSVKATLRRLDHANIFIFIAATYTPLALVLLPGPEAAALLALIWTVAVVGVSVRMFWQTAPRWLDVVCYLLLGWAGIGWLPAFWVNGGPTIVILIGVGGLVYSLGALVYARKWPDPSPKWFGFHEIFHACTIVAALCHFAAIALAVLR